MIRLNLNRIFHNSIPTLTQLPFHKFATASTTTSTTSSSASSSKKTLYQYLQIPPSATNTNIKQNYLRLAKIYHPDVYKGKDKSRFQKIQQAYKTLSDRIKRAKYDQQIGYARKMSQEDKYRNDDVNVNDKPGENYGKPKNTMDYQTTQKQQAINIDEQFNKFFNQKPKTQFEEIRLNEQPQIRQMSQAQRIRRHFSQVYHNNDAINRASFQKEYTSILNDTISQKNRMHEESVKNQKKFEQINKQKNVNKMKKRVLFLFVIGCIATFAPLYSFVTKYNLEKQEKRKYQEAYKNIQKEVQEMGLRARLKYE